MGAEGVALPPDLTLVTLAERPELADAVDEFGSAPWPEFLHHDAVADEHWHRLAEDWSEFQFALLDEAGALAAVARSAPLTWNRTVADLPGGWDQQFERSVADLDAGAAVDTLGALMIVVGSDRRGERLGGAMVSALQACARLHGYHSLIACVRPTLKGSNPRARIDEYAAWTREDGLPFDPWIRIHVRLGGRVSRPEPESMLIRGSVAEWESWTGLTFPTSGSYVVPGAGSTVEIDRENDIGTHSDPNVWVIHDLGGG